MDTTPRNGACTIVSPNYLPYARTLATSYKKHHPNDDFFVLVVAKDCSKDLFADEPFLAVTLSEIHLGNLECLAMKYSILELNTNVKPSFIKYILTNFNIDKLIYLDPDIYIYDRLEPVFDLLETANVVLTPHITSPIDDEKEPGEQAFLAAGTYNLGFIGIRRSSETARMLDWWERRCLDDGFNEIRTGLFVDQKWMNLAPSLFEGVVQCKDPGCNMAYWNLHERSLAKNGSQYIVNGSKKLRFFHFSGVNVDHAEALSKYTDRFDLQCRPDLVEIFAGYKAEVITNRNEVLDKIPYGFDHFDNGIAVTQLARRIFAASEARFDNEDPFSASSKFYQFARKMHLISAQTAEVKSSWKHYDPSDRRVIWIQRLLRAGLYVLGPNRYELLLKYLSHITVMREQYSIMNN